MNERVAEQSLPAADVVAEPPHVVAEPPHVTDEPPQAEAEPPHVTDGAVEVVAGGLNGPEIVHDAIPGVSIKSISETVLLDVARTIGEIARSERVMGFLRILIRDSVTVAVFQATGKEPPFTENLEQHSITPGAISELVKRSLIANLRRRKPEMLPGRNSFSIVPLKVAALLEGRDLFEDEIGLEDLSLDELRRMAMVSYEAFHPYDAAIFREAMRRRELSPNDRLHTLIQLVMAYQAVRRLEKALERAEELLTFLRDDKITDQELGSKDSRALNIYKTQISIWKLRDLLGQDNEDDGEVFAVCSAFMASENPAPGYAEDACGRLSMIYERRGDIGRALDHARRRHAYQVELNVPTEIRGGKTLERVEKLERIFEPKDLQEAVAKRAFLNIKQLLEWTDKTCSGVKARIALRESLAAIPDGEMHGKVATLIYLGNDYKDDNDLTMALDALDRALKIESSKDGGRSPDNIWKKIGDIELQMKKRQGTITTRRQFENRSEAAARHQQRLRASEDVARRIARAAIDDYDSWLTGEGKGPNATVESGPVADFKAWLQGFSREAEAWIDGSSIRVPADKKTALLASLDNILQDEAAILAAMSNGSLARGDLRQFRNNLHGGNVKNSVLKKLARAFGLENQSEN